MVRGSYKWSREWLRNSGFFALYIAHFHKQIIYLILIYISDLKGIRTIPKICFSFSLLVWFVVCQV
jgi:hypothetical protein